MFLRVKTVKSNPYFYLVENERVEGKPNPIQQIIEYLGNRDQALAALEASDYLNKDKLLARVRATAPACGSNNGKRGRPRKADAQVNARSLETRSTPIEETLRKVEQVLDVDFGVKFND